MEVPARGRALAAARGAEEYWCGLCRFNRTDNEAQHDKFHKELEAKQRAKDAERTRNEKKKNARKNRNDSKKKGRKPRKGN